MTRIGSCCWALTRTALASVLLAFGGDFACSSGGAEAPDPTATGRGGATMGGEAASGSSGGSSSSSGTGGAPSNGGGLSASGGASGSIGGNASSTGGYSARATGGTVSNGTGGAVSTGGRPIATGGRSGGAPNATGGNASGSGGLGGSGGSATGGNASSSGGSAGTNPDFDPCPATGNCKILPLGDSITAGAGAQPGENGGYRVELFKNALADGKHITFVGSMTSGPSTVSGQTFPKNHEGHIGWTIAQVNGIATTAQSVSVSGMSYAGALRDTPNIVLLFIGTNDEGYASSQAGASDRLSALVDKIVAALPNALLVVSSIYPFPGCQSTGYTPTQCAANVATYDAAIPGVIQQRIAQGKHLLFVDMSAPPAFALSTDNVHPNSAVGYPWMGDTWYGVIKAYLH